MPHALRRSSRLTRKRIALLVHRFGGHFGGAEAYVEHLARELSLRHDVTIIAFDYASDLNLPFIQVPVPACAPGWLKAVLFARFAQRVTQTGYDIVHSHMNGAAGQVHTVHVTPAHYHLKFRGSAWRRCVSRISVRKQAYLALERARFGPQKQAVVVSARLGQQITHCMPVFSDLVVIAPGVHAAQQLPGARYRQRSLLNWREDVVACLLVARNPERKGLATLIETARRLPANYRFMIVGVDQVASDMVMVAPDVRERFVLHPPTASLGSWFAAADVYVHPTREDTFGMAPLEAMAHGVPVIVSGPRYCGFAQQLRHEQDALLLDDPQDSRRIAQELTRLGTDPALREKLVKAGLRCARERSWEGVAQAHEQLYDKVVQAK